MPAEPLHCDVLVVGGGPGGSSTAALLARKGWRVLLAEKDHHPRFHIGESLLPANLPLFEELGVLDQVAAIGVRKFGADFPCQVNGYQTFRFDRALGNTPGSAFQVQRDQFDQLLFRHAADSGADARQGLVIERVQFSADGVVAQALCVQQGPIAIHARYLVDASGRDTLLARTLRLKRRNRQHQSAAIFAHFDGVERRLGEDAGNISIYRFEQGWAWFIPLPDGAMSIGCVCWPDHLKQRRTPADAFLIETLRSIPEAWQRMGSATMRGPARVTGNYSYSARAMAGRNWIMVGDAYAFVDPIFSSGVFLAMHSASRAAAVVDTSLRHPRLERTRQRTYARELRTGIATLSWFIHRFNSPIMRKMFAQPSQFFQLDQGVIGMLAGNVFGDRAIRRRLRLFRAIYSVMALLDCRAHWQALRHRRRQARVGFDHEAQRQERA